jgi:hypothetical protein
MRSRQTERQQLRTGSLPKVLTYLRCGLIKLWGIRDPTDPHKAPSHRSLQGCISYTQADRKLAKHASDKLLWSESAVAMLIGLAIQVCDEFHQGLAQAAEGLHCEGHEAVAGRTIPSVENSLLCVPPCGSAAVTLCVLQCVVHNIQ